MSRLIVLTILVVAPLGLCGTAVAGWKIERMNLSPNTDGTARVTATLSQPGSSRKVTVDSDVPFTHLQQFFVASEKLALLGRANSTDAVAVFDLKSGNEVDWFYCYAPQRVWETWIAFVEWYPNHTSELTTDVVLIYDLGVSPNANRIDNSVASVLPPIKTGRPTRVGVPIFPESNVTHRTYTNVVEDQNQVHLILGGPGFVMTPDKKLVFVVSKEPGGDARSISDHLAIVNLSKGLSSPISTSMPIPEEQLKIQPKKPGFIQVNSLELETPTKLRVSVPKDEYGVGSIEVRLPDP